MINLTDLEKKINSELTTKIKKSEIRHDQLYINIDSENLRDVTFLRKMLPWMNYVNRLF